MAPIFLFLNNYLFMTVLDLHFCEDFFSSCSEQGLLSRCGAYSSHCDSFSLQTQAMGFTGSVVASPRL